MRARSMWTGICVGMLVAAGAASASGGSGDLDTGFASGGLLQEDLAGSVWGGAAVQADGRLVVVTRGTQGASLAAPWLVRRLLPTGAPDATFGSGGEVELFPTHGGGATDVVIDSLGRILVAGSAKVEVTKTVKGKTQTTVESRPVVARLLAGGSLDSTYGTGGIAQPAVGGLAGIADMVLLPDGRVVACGEVHPVGKGGYPDAMFCLLRLRADGTLDPTFDGDGWLLHNPVPNGRGSGSYEHLAPQDALAVQADGRIVLGYRASSAPLAPAWRLVRFTASGGLDTPFSPPAGSTFVLHSLSVDAHDRILASGNDDSQQALVVRYAVDGSVDSSFGTAGRVDLAAGFGPSIAGRTTTDAAGRVVVTLTYLLDAGNDTISRPVRLLANGTPDVSFGDQGLGEALGVPGWDVALQRGLAVASDGAVWMAGYLGSTPTGGAWAFDAGVARWLGD